MRWRSLDGMGRAALADGALDSALVPWDASRELFVHQSVLVPLRHGRGTFLDQRSPVVAAHLRTLLELGRPAEAFEMARSWRAQLLATTWLVDRIGALDDTGRRRWDGVVADVDRLRHERERLLDKRRAAPSDEVQRIEEQLRRVEQQESDALDTGMSALSLGTDSAGRPREPGETRLLVLTATRPVGQGPLEIWAKGPDLPAEAGYLPIVQDDRGVASGAWVSAAEVAAAPERLLAVLAGRLDGARSITLLLPGALEGVDLQAVKVGDRSLIQRAPVSWSIDRAANAMLRGTGAARRALVVGDPGGGLAGARDEATAVAQQLRSQGWQVTLLSGAAARLPAVLAELGGDGVELLHFAGHGEMGEDAWDARLVLAGGTVLGVRDVLALEHPPRLVVLAGCETARSEGIGIAGMGLAQAFVNAGSEAVVATARKVDDHLARRFSSAWYADGAALDAPGAGFQRVVEGLSVSEASADWAGFRLISR